MMYYDTHRHWNIDFTLDFRDSTQMWLYKNITSSAQFPIKTFPSRSTEGDNNKNKLDKKNVSGRLKGAAS